jgi:cytochrome c oxidase subunit 2
MRLAGMIAAALASGAAAGLGLAAAPPADDARVVHVTARQFAFEPSVIVLKKGEPVRLEFTSADRLHGLNVPGLGLRAEIPPGRAAAIALTPQAAGSFPFVCDAFCGSGHDEMDGRIVVAE